MKKTKLFLPAFLSASLLACVSAGIVLASTYGSIQGTVTDDAGKPVAGVKVTLAGSGSATTDKSGSFDIEGVDPGVYHLQAAKKGYQLTLLDVTITQDVPQEVDLTLTPASGS